MLKNKPGVYMILNNVNNHRYVGSAARSIANRWAEHRYSLRNNKHRNQHLQNAWNKYSEQSFSFVVLENCKPESVLDAEQQWYELFKAQGLPLYNKRENVASQLGFKHSSKTKERIGKLVKLRYENTEYKNKIAQATKNAKDNPISKEKFINSLKRTWNTIEYRTKRGISFDFQFISASGELHSTVNLSNLCNENNLSISAMLKVHKSELKHYKGWRKYTGQELTAFNGTIRADGVPHTIISPNGLVYNDIRNLEHFCNKHGLHVSGMRSVMIGECHQHKGWTGYRQGYEPKPEYDRTTRDWPLLLAPDNAQHAVRNLTQFCKEQDLDKAAMQRVCNGKSKSHKGWRLA
jgi:group I intron endonuclease